MGTSCGTNLVQQWFTSPLYLPPWLDALLIKCSLRVWGWLIGKYYKPWERRVWNGELFFIHDRRCNHIKGWRWLCDLHWALFFSTGFHKKQLQYLSWWVIRIIESRIQIDQTQHNAALMHSRRPMKEVSPGNRLALCLKQMQRLQRLVMQSNTSLLQA